MTGRWLAAALLLLPAVTFADPLPGDVLARKLDAAVAPLFRADEPGGAVILTREGRWIFRKGYGIADRRTGRAVQPDMAFRIGSVTKQLTAAGIFLLADEGGLALDDDITRFFPDFPARGRRITVEHLLTHTSGIRSYTEGLIAPEAFAVDKTVREIYEAFRDEPRRFEPGEATAYSNSNYFLLGAIIEKVSGLPYADFMAKRVFEPLGMRSTAYEGFERNGVRRVEGYVRGRNKPFENALPISMTQPFAAGAVISTVEDLARWGEAIDQRRLLTSESWKRMFRPFVLNDGRVTRTASGWFVDRHTFGREAWGHGGGIDGFASFVFWVPQDRIFIAVLLNNAGETISPLHIAQTMLHVALQPAE